MHFCAVNFFKNGYWKHDKPNRFINKRICYFCRLSCSCVILHSVNDFLLKHGGKFNNETDGIPPACVIAFGMNKRRN